MALMLPLCELFIRTQGILLNIKLASRVQFSPFDYPNWFDITFNMQPAAYPEPRMSWIQERTATTGYNVVSKSKMDGSSVRMSEIVTIFQAKLAYHSRIVVISALCEQIVDV